jgi:two-component system, OmpR family, sensor histidine kinase ChvG
LTQSTPYTAQDTDLPEAEPRELWLRWSGWLSLRQRILAVNVFALALLAGSVFYLDSYRARLIDERIRQTEQQAEVIAVALTSMDRGSQQAFLDATGRREGERLRLADSSGAIVADSWADGDDRFEIRDPKTEPWQRVVARWLDDTIDFFADASARRCPDQMGSVRRASRGARDSC